MDEICRIHSINMAIPSCKIVEDIPEKNKVISSIIPGQSSYSFNDEASYYNEYRESYFAVTMKKSGWDCNRHYEIMANGCIPVFINIEQCPPKILSRFPKDLLRLAMFDLRAAIETGQMTDLDLEKYKFYCKQILDYTRENLTTKNMALDVLKKSGCEEAKRILFLSNDTQPDYIRDQLLHGFKEILGKSCHDYFPISYLYTNYEHAERLGGRGITYSRLLDRGVYRDEEEDKHIEKHIMEHYYDAIVYSSAHRGADYRLYEHTLPRQGQATHWFARHTMETMLYWNLVHQYYKPSELILVCGEDEHDCMLKKFASKGYNLFIREHV